MIKQASLIIGCLATVIAVVLAFENIANSASVLIGFHTINGLFMPMMIMFMIGMVAGFSFCMAHKSKNQAVDYSDDL